MAGAEGGRKDGRDIDEEEKRKPRGRGGGGGAKIGRGRVGQREMEGRRTTGKYGPKLQTKREEKGKIFSTF
jgi:hypothetical protein